MVERGKGTILFTGCSASLNGIAGYSELCKYYTIIYFFILFIGLIMFI